MKFFLCIAFAQDTGFLFSRVEPKNIIWEKSTKVKMG